MAIQRFFGNFDFSAGEIEISNQNIIHQIKNVLRLKIGDEIILCDGKLNEVICKIAGIDKKFLNLKIIRIFKNGNEPEKDIVLYCSILKKENFELVVQKAVEMGVKEIVPIIAKRTVKFGLNYERLNKIIKEAAEQSGRGILPILSRATDFKKAVEEAKQNDINLFFDLSGKKFAEIKPKLNCKKIGLFIGPKGGWDAEELNLIKENNKFIVLSFGSLTLRAETAAIAASYLTFICV